MSPRLAIISGRSSGKPVGNVAELADAPGSNPGALRGCGGSTPPVATDGVILMSLRGLGWCIPRTYTTHFSWRFNLATVFLGMIRFRQGVKGNVDRAGGAQPALTNRANYSCER